MLKRKPIEVGQISDTFIQYYKTILANQLSPEEIEEVFAKLRTPLPSVFRLSHLSPNISKIEEEMNSHFENLRSLGVDATEIKAFPPDYGRIYRLPLDKGVLRRDERFRPFRDWLNLQTKLGRCHRQEFVSMTPPYFLDVHPDHSVLDTCAAPGSKTTQIIERLGDNGYVIANDSDPKRCHPLVHQLQRIGTQNVLVSSSQAQFLDFKGEQFDRVLCDVPCTGDGTLRKNPAAGAHWTPKGAGAMHGLQKLILKRGLELLKVGGKCVYSTCSMNPIEDEAVVNSVLLELRGAVEIVDTSEMFPELKRHNGLTDWVVYDTGKDDLETVYKTPEDVLPSRKQHGHPSIFPQPQVEGLSRCMRFYPQDFDSGGFFVAVLTKVKEFERVTSPPSKPQKPLTEAPYLPMKQQVPEVLECIKNIFGLQDDFPYDQLYVRDEKAVHTIYFVGERISKLINEYGSVNLRTISCGCPIFTWRSFASDKKATPYPCDEGIPVLIKYATKRVFRVTPEEMRLLLIAGHKAVPFNQFSKETFQQMENVDSTGAIFYIPDTPFRYGGMTFKSSASVYLRKDLLPVELEKLLLAYPNLPKEENENK
ncbi:NOL1/NOP2/sun family protein [Histomonas meleagridis]|uniref:NOL1/NOP2/sun family protein n=1 Tax=Histomonas meleagridis TaxID=135588 RepID=UPI00355A9104|nr:NOL1/NOP2/sun family protein [Histomonas meleagridis]KAH0796784.1 NOL1/NOP2/sun family protein [Histomonas meleagridis]